MKIDIMVNNGEPIIRLESESNAEAFQVGWLLSQAALVDPNAESVWFDGMRSLKLALKIKKK